MIFQNTAGKSRKTYIVMVCMLFYAICLPAHGIAEFNEGIGGQQAGVKLGRLPYPFPSPDEPDFHRGLSAGTFLVAGRYLRDPRFMETVIFLVNYSQQGAMGVIINRPTEVKVSTIFPDMKGLQQSTDTVYIGGPVAQKQMVLLATLDSQPENSFPVLDNIYLILSGTVFKKVVAEIKKGERFRVYAGYAGWSPGQLEREISRGDWCILPADVKTLFEKSSSAIWPELMNRCSAMQVRNREAIFITVK